MSLNKHFSFFDIKSTKNISSKILLKTKELTLSRQKYNSFIESFTKDNSTDKPLYALPILRIKHSESQKNIKQNNANTSKNIILSYKSKNFTKNNHNQNKRNEQFFISELNSINNNKNKEEIKDNEENENLIIKLKRCLKFHQKVGNKYKKNINFVNFLKKQKKEKQIFLLIDSIFSDKKEQKNIEAKKFKYDEANYIGYKEKYLSYLQNELSLLHQGKKEIGQKYVLYHEYDNRIYGKIKLELTSVNILITNKENGEKYFSLDIPFDLVCLFYLSHIKELSYIILSLLRNQNIIENDKNNLIKELKDIIIKQISFANNNLKYNLNIDEEDRKNVFDDYLNRRNLKNKDNVKYNFLSLFSKKEAFKQTIFENCTFRTNINFNFDSEENIIYNFDNMKTLKILFETNINTINFSWISFKNNFNIKITMPKIIIYFPKFKKELNHFIHHELFVYLLMNNFSNFNNILIHYLFTLKKFRTGIYKALSYNDLIKFNPEFSDILNNDNYLLNNIIYDKYHISNIRFEDYENSLNDNEYIFYVSDDEKFHLYKMKSYTLYIYSMKFLEDLKKSKIFFFNFSFHHMKVLFYKNKYDNLIQFLQRLLTYNPVTKKIFFDYKFFSSFKYMTTDQIDKFFKESSLKVKENIKNEENEIIQNDLVLRLVEPKFVSVSVSKKNFGEEIIKDIDEVKKVGNVGNILIEKLIQNDIKDWGKILWKNKNYIEPLRKTKSRKSVFGGKKDFKAIFKKFLKID